MTNWTDIHKGFDEYYQQKWERTNITKQETKKWITVGFKPDDYRVVEKWKNCNFSPVETKVWLEVGLDEKEDSEFASWLRTNNHIPELVKGNLEQLRNDYNQYWLTKHYPNHNIKELGISSKNLKGELNLSQYQQLERLNCSSNNLTNLILPTSLKELYLRSNNFPEQDLSFLVPCTNLEILNLGHNNFIGSLDYLSGMEQLKKLNISDTDLNEVQIDKLPRSLKRIWYSTNERPDCKLKTIIPLLETVQYGFCQKCYKSNTSENWCQFCAEQEWQSLTGQELINRFIEQQKRLKWIPYEQFTNIEYLAEGGFSKIYKAKWEWRNVVLKSLNNSNNITLDFLSEIANTKLVDGYDFVVNCHGISQDLTTKNYLMVMQYMEDGNLREYLQNKDNELSLEDKFWKLVNIATGLRNIHRQNLVHQDFHSGNILNSTDNYKNAFITDLGLSRPVNHQKQTGQIFGVLPYVAPEVLRSEPYTKKADIYSFGIITYELLANSYPYPEMDNLALAVCNGLRPNLDKVPLPLLLKDLIKNCWDSNLDKRPDVEKLYDIINNWESEIRNKKSTPFYHQCQAIEAEYNILSKKPYQIHTNAITTSKMIDTKTITQQLATYSLSTQMDFLKLEEEQLQTHQETPPKQ